MEKKIAIKSIKKICLKNPEEIFCINIKEPHEIIIETKHHKGKYAIRNCLFGMHAVTFAKASLKPNWSDAQAEKFIEENDLYDLKFAVAQKYKNDSPEDWNYIAAAEYIRSQYFKTYPGLMRRIENYRKFAKEHGYIRSIHGAIRHTPVLGLRGDDDDRKEIAGLDNIAVNTTIQNDEACRVMPSIEIFENWLDENNMKSYTFGTVHDSADMAIHKDEIEIVLPKIHEIFEREESWQQGIPLTVDIKIADLNRGEHYKGGLKEKAFLKRMKNG